MLTLQVKTFQQESLSPASCPSEVCFWSAPLDLSWMFPINGILPPLSFLRLLTCFKPQTLICFLFSFELSSLLFERESQGKLKMRCKETLLVTVCMTLGWGTTVGRGTLTCSQAEKRLTVHAPKTKLRQMQKAGKKSHKLESSLITPGQSEV